MKTEEILTYCDHTELKQTATFENIKALIDDAVRFRTASVCIPPCYVKQAAEYAAGRVPVCTVIGFPNGYNTTAVKLFETKEALDNGADEIDMVINIGKMKAKDYDFVGDEIAQLKKVCGDKVLKVIIETCLLTDEEKKIACDLVTRAGADFIKTSTGFSTAGATFEDIELFAANVGKNVKIKAAGGIHSLEDAERFIGLGASRLGTSALVRIAKETASE